MNFYSLHLHRHCHYFMTLSSVTGISVTAWCHRVHAISIATATSNSYLHVHVMIGFCPSSVLSSFNFLYKTCRPCSWVLVRSLADLPALCLSPRDTSISPVTRRQVPVPVKQRRQVPGPVTLRQVPGPVTRRQVPGPVKQRRQLYSTHNMRSP